jgi:hypothetical protein
MPSSAANLHPSQKKVDKIKSQEDAKKEEVVVGRKNKYLKKKSHSSSLQLSSPNPQVALNSVLKKSQTSPTFHGMMISFKSNNNQV